MSENLSDYSAWKEKVLRAKKILADYDKQEGNSCVEKIGSLLPVDPVVAIDVGMHQCWCAQSLVLKGQKGRILISGGYGTMGCALPFAIGASIARNKSVTYCIVGDGGLQMNIQELETIIREELPIKIFVLNNRVLGKISETQHFNHNDRYANTTCDSGYSVPDFQRIAEAYGMKAFTLESYHMLNKYKNYIEDNHPYLFNIMLSEESRLTPKIKWETSLISPQLDKQTEFEVRRILSE